MSSPRHHAVAVLPGDGIGVEVMPPALEAVDLLGGLHGFEVAWTEYPWGCDHYLEHGAMMPEDGIAALAEHDAILLGAVGAPGVPDHVSLWGLLIPIRRAFDQYVNLRPALLLPGVESPLRETAGGIDILVVRENSEGEYSEIGGRVFPGTDRELALQEAVFSRRGIERVVRFAAGLAESRGGTLVSATKSNGIIHSMPFWDEVFADVLAEHPGVEGRLLHVDALAARFISHPGELDVVVGSNLFGDILTDIGAVIVGSMGMAPSANLNPEREHPSMFEPVHGSAPDIAGRGIANPIGQIWSAAMMLDHLGERAAHDAALAAIRRVLGETGIRTPDLGGTSSTREVADAVLAAIRDHAMAGAR
ncbi:tartrate dehydrogenase [Homoserinibacter sp. YIM 151385]|uniref:tartrate dehydrogenase n=1 Tax=Homoserinibacter sp. YIM 151385 TaxID=2985506 RepID=UPI0022F0FDCC|nr:tartrate dehydrogenase [Homoserinibacter sp. YIM 151385]WBU37101.1 tartrate dehydrogenase [Homoserinibacter sp. YIM 151385]